MRPKPYLHMPLGLSATALLLCLKLAELISISWWVVAAPFLAMWFIELLVWLRSR